MNLAATLMTNNKHFSSVEIALPNGSKYNVSMESDGSIVRRSDIRTKTNVIRTCFYDNPSFPSKEKDSVKSLEKGYDARTRPWFIEAVNAQKMVWTDMYVSSTAKQFVYSCVMPVYGEKNNLLAVTAIDIQLGTLSEFLGTLKILEHGKAFIMNNHDQVIAVPIHSMEELDKLFKKNPEGSSEPYQFYNAEELPDHDIREAILTYRRDGKNFFELAGKDSEPLTINMVEYSYEKNSTFKIGIIVPKSDIIGGVIRNTHFMILGVLLSMFFILLVGFRVSKRISISLAVLSDEVNKVSKLELDSSVLVNSNIQEIATIEDAVRNMKNGLRSFKKYVPSELVMQLNTLNKEAVLEGERKHLSIFFSDIADFTSISEQLSPEELVQQLSIYFDGMSRSVLSNGGTLDKYIGDAIMAFWGAPISQENHARLACEAALECQQYLEHLAIESENMGHHVFHTRIGIHTGEVIVGNIGYEDRMNYTVIGDAVNLASRLEGLNKFYRTKIIISEDTFKQVQDEFIARKLDIVKVKGKSQGVPIYELIAARGCLNSTEEKFLQSYEQAIEFYLKRSWLEARQAFVETEKLSPRGIDYPSKILAERCDKFMQHEPESDWNGIYTH